VVLAAIVLKPFGENGSYMPAPAPQAGEVITRVIDYSYDPLYRLTGADYDDGTFFHYTYDAVGNRITQATLAGTNNYVYDIANRLIEVDGVSYTWDANGNLLSDGMRAYSYNHANRLLGVSQGVDTYAFGYNGIGDRLQQVVNGAPTSYTLDLNTGLTQVLADGTNAYLYGLGRIGEAQPDGWQYHLPDALGSSRQIIDSADIVNLSKSYDPFGSVLATAGDDTSSYGFIGEWKDKSEFIYLRSRYYSPNIGRFISIDPSYLEDNLYSYAENNPISFIDPTGLDAWRSPIEAIIGIHYASTWGAGHLIRYELPVEGGSKQGLERKVDNKGNPYLTGTPTGSTGWIDLVDVNMSMAYEIKRERYLLQARAEIAWYVTTYNTNPGPKAPSKLIPGTNYAWLFHGWQVIGTNPVYPGQAILAVMQAPGVISWKAVRKDKIPVPLPKYVFEWDPETRTVKKEKLNEAPMWRPALQPMHSEALEACKLVIVVGITIIILIDIFPDETAIPFVWQLMR
jgi:RHS repeat-associated protein